MERRLQRCPCGDDLFDHMHELLHTIIHNQGEIMSKQDDALTALAAVELAQAATRADIAQLATDMQAQGDAAFQPFIDRLNALAAGETAADAQVKALDAGVKPVATTVSTNPTSLTLAAGNTQQITASATDQNGQPFVGTATFQSADQTVATVAPDGTVTAVATGTTQVTVQIGAASASVSVTVQ